MYKLPYVISISVLFIFKAGRAVPECVSHLLWSENMVGKGWEYTSWNSTLLKVSEWESSWGNAIHYSKCCVVSLLSWKRLVWGVCRRVIHVMQVVVVGWVGGGLVVFVEDVSVLGCEYSASACPDYVNLSAYYMGEDVDSIRPYLL